MPRVPRAPRVQITQHDQKTYQALLNGIRKAHPLINFDNDTFIKDHANPRTGKMYKYITENNFSLSSQKNFFNLIRKWFALNDMNNQHSKFYLDAYKNAYTEIQNNEKKNEQTEREKLNYRSHKWLLENVVNPHKNDYNMMNRYDLMQYLAACLPILQPPLRTDFYCTCKFLLPGERNNGVDNYIQISGTRMFYIVNRDKVTNRANRYQQADNKKIEIKSKLLKQIIQRSYDTFPRTLVLQSRNHEEEEISQSTFLSWIRKQCGGIQITNNNLRSSYVNFVYDNHPTYEAMEQLSRQMRHDVRTAAINYRKIIENNEEVMEIRDIHELRTDLNDEQNDNQHLQEQNDNLRANCKADIDREKKLKKQRYDAIRIGNIRKSMKQSTMDKYGIQLVNGVYV